MDGFFAIINPAAGGGRARKLASPAVAKLRAQGLKIETAETAGVGDAVQLARRAYQQGFRKFLAVGGDGTAHEIINGVWGAPPGDRVSLGFLPLGTGNSFLRDYTKDGAEASLQAVLEGRTRSVDLLRLTHAAGEIYSFNLISVGFTADVATLTNRAFKPLGHAGYLLGVVTRLAQLRRRAFALRCDDDREWDERRCLFLTFNNSKFTGGTMMIAPDADASDGFIEYVRWGPIGRAGLVRMLPKLYDGTHLAHPLASRRAVRHVEFNLPGAVDVMIDGEVATLECRRVDIVPAALDVYI